MRCRPLRTRCCCLAASPPRSASSAFCWPFIASARPADEIELPMSRLDMADYLGLTIETVSRMMTSLARRGLIRATGRHRIALRKLSALRDIAGRDEHEGDAQPSRRRGGPSGQIDVRWGTDSSESSEHAKPVASVDFADMAQVLDLTNIVIHDEDGKILHWTTGCQRLYGWSSDESARNHRSRASEDRLSPASRRNHLAGAQARKLARRARTAAEGRLSRLGREPLGRAADRRRARSSPSSRSTATSRN